MLPMSSETMTSPWSPRHTAVGALESPVTSFCAPAAEEELLAAKEPQTSKPFHSKLGSRRPANCPGLEQSLINISWTHSAWAHFHNSSKPSAQSSTASQSKTQSKAKQNKAILDEF